MRIFIVGALLLTLGLALGGPVLAEEAGSAADKKAIHTLRNTQVQMEFDSQSVPEVLSFIGMMSGLEIVGGDALKSVEVTFKVQGISLASVLALTLRQTDHTYRVSDGKVKILLPDAVEESHLEVPAIPRKVIRKKLRALKKASVSLEFKGGSVREFMQHVAQASGVNVVLDERVIRAAKVDLASKVEPLEGEHKLLKALSGPLATLELAVVYHHEVLLVTTRAEAKSIGAK